MSFRALTTGSTGIPDDSAERNISTSGSDAHSHVKHLAEAIILQAIEDLWSPGRKRESLLFFKGKEFSLCAEVAGISYIKQLNMLRMLADAGDKTKPRIMRKAL
ncbi:MAG: hypothetical protein M1510_00165 [Nitrospirae bacterium]|nr:hypothetical protein [Nitrospirota bacterium]